MIIYGNQMHDNVTIFSHTANQAYLHTDSLSLCCTISHPVESAGVLLLCAEELWYPGFVCDET